MPELRKCQTCRAEIESNAPSGQCPRCLLALGFARSEKDPPETSQVLVPPPYASRSRYFGEYELLEQIGRGAMGVVFKARQLNLHRFVALKMIGTGELASPTTVQRFQLEAEAAAKLDHPSIVPIYEVGVHEGQHYFSMKLVEGLNLKEKLRQRGHVQSSRESGSTQLRLGARDSAQLLVTVARAVHYAHQHGVLHRDLKPANILIDEEGRPYLTDFGLAKILEHEIGVTRTAEIIGTPGYMSPEQTAGRQISTATDIWSLGVILYELLTGRLPFHAETTPALLRTIAETEPLAPSRIKNTESLAADLEVICLKCLEKDPTHRYDSAGALADDLERWLRNEPILARPSSLWEQIVKWGRRQPMLAATTFLLLTVACFGIGAVIWQWREAVLARAGEASARQRAEMQLRRAESAEHQMRQSLRDAYIAQAHAMRLTGKRVQSLAALRKAATIRPSLEARNEAIACLVLPDIQPIQLKNWEDKSEWVVADSSCDRYAVAATNGAITVRRFSDDVELATLPAIGPTVTFPARFSPDGKLVGYCYSDRRLRVWDWTKAALVLETADYGDLDFSPDGKRLVTSDSTNLVLHSLSQPTVVKSVPCGGFLSSNSIGEFMFQFRFHPSKSLVAVSSRNRTNVLIVDIDSGKTVLDLSHPKHVYQTAWHPGGRYLATGCTDQLMYLWDTATGKRFKTLSCHAVSLTFNRSGNLLAASGWNGGTFLWEFPIGRQLAFTLDNGVLSGFSSDDKRLMIGGWKGSKSLESAEIIHGLGLSTVYEQETHAESGPANLVYSADGQYLAYTVSGGIGLWSVRAGRDLGGLRGPLAVMGFDSLGDHLLLTSSSNVVRWPFRGSVPTDSISRLSSPLVPLSPATQETAEWLLLREGGLGRTSTSGHVCAVVRNQRCQIFRADTLAQQAETDVQSGMKFIAISPDGSLVATGARGLPGVKVWDARTGKLVKELWMEDQRQGTSVLFSPDGRRLVTSVANQYHFWDVATWTLALHIPQSKEFVPARMAFSHDGKLFAGTFSQSKVRLYDAASGEALADLEAPHPQLVAGLAFSPDGNLAVCEVNTTIKIWDLKWIRGQLADMGLDW